MPKSGTVRTILIYGENNPVDGAVLDVILRKARAIEKQTGVQLIPDRPDVATILEVIERTL